MTFALYRGTSLISRLIGWFTRSVYSHVAILFDDGRVFEAIGDGFVRANDLWKNHEAGTIVEILEFRQPLLPFQVKEARAMCELLVGKPYDYAMALAGFPFRARGESKGASQRLFCSEAVAIVTNAIGAPVCERTLPWKVSPEDINKSSTLKWVRTITL